MPARRLWLLAMVVPVLLWWGGSQATRQAARNNAPELPNDICFVATATPYDPQSGIAPDAPRAIPPRARCPVCGALPSRAPDWAAQVIFADGDAYFFDSPLSLFLYLHNLPRYAPGRHAGDIVATYVRNTDDGRWLAARQAVYVRGSSVPGPMRRGNLPAFPDGAGAQHFIARHGGTVVRPAEITAQLLQTLEPGRAHAAADHS